MVVVGALFSRQKLLEILVSVIW